MDETNERPFEGDRMCAVIEPRRGKNEPEVTSSVLMGFTSQDLAFIRKSLGIAGKPDRMVDFARLWSLPKPMAGVSLVGPALGAPAAAILMERLIALGARRIVGIGSCGSLQPRLTIGEVVVPDGALPEEGTSAHYQTTDPHPVPDGALAEALKRYCRLQGPSPHSGAIWTTDAPFRETLEKVERYRDAGYLTVEMEASALMAVAAFRGVSFSSLLVVSDEIGELKWKPGFSNPRFLDGLNRAARAAAQCLVDFA
jgi:uridine phosphorylase